MTPDEAELWRQLTHSVDKVKVKPRVADHAGDGPAPPTAGPASGVERSARPSAGSRHPAPPAPMAPAVPPAPRPPAPAQIDRRTLRQVSGGKLAIDARLDLHGLHQDQAHSRLRTFLMSSQAKGHRMVLVITGKGGATGQDSGESAGPRPRGVLRRCVPLWLEEPELRALVLSYAAAGVRHGGEGALYIRLRKAREG